MSIWAYRQLYRCLHRPYRVIWSSKDLSKDLFIELRGVETQSKMEQLMLTSERNRIMRLELLMGMGTSSLAVSTVIAGFFGRSGARETSHGLVVCK